MKKIKLGLLGCGTVGTGVVKLLQQNKKVIEARLGAEFVLKYVADTDQTTDRGVSFEDGVFITDAYRVVDDPDIDIVIEMIGGKTVARDLILRAFENKKHVVTANKALLAEQGAEIFEAADLHGVDIAYEASVGRCMPIIKTMRESLAGNRIQHIIGILNGTSNYILSKITGEGISFEAALARAQENGYAEADPTLDVEGIDAAHKIAILSALAYGTRVDFSDVYIQGISGITPMDIAFAGEFGYRIKLLAISKIKDGSVDIRVHPTMIPFDNLLSNVNGTVNAVTVSADAAGDILLYGHGAGMMPTASAVISDTVDLARNMISGGSSRIPLLAFQPDLIRTLPVTSIDEITTHYYIRFSAVDNPGVLSKIAGVLGAHGISIKQVHQKGRKLNGSVPVVMLTHLAREADIQRAMSEMSSLEVISNEPTLIRIEDQDSED